MDRYGTLAGAALLATASVVMFVRSWSEGGSALLIGAPGAIMAGVAAAVLVWQRFRG